MPTRGPKGASNKKKSQQQNKQKAPTQRGHSTSRRRPRSNTGRNGKVDGINNDTTNDNSERKKEQTIMIAAEEKAYEHRSEQVTTAVTSKIRQQFGFVADPKKTLLHNASSTHANTPTWYYFSRPSHLAFHDFTQQKQPAKNLRSLLGLGLKFIPTPTRTNIWNKLKETTMTKFERAIHLRFHFAGSTESSDEPYEPKMYVRSNWTPPHWTRPPVVLDKRLKTSHIN